MEFTRKIHERLKVINAKKHDFKFNIDKKREDITFYVVIEEQEKQFCFAAPTTNDKVHEASVTRKPSSKDEALFNDKDPEKILVQRIPIDDEEKYIHEVEVAFDEWNNWVSYFIEPELVDVAARIGSVQESVVEVGEQVYNVNKKAAEVESIIKVAVPLALMYAFYDTVINNHEKYRALYWFFSSDLMTFVMSVGFFIAFVYMLHACYAVICKALEYEWTKCPWARLKKRVSSWCQKK